MIFIERLLLEIIQNDPKTAISFQSKRPKFMKKDAKNPITVSRVGPRWPTLDNNVFNMGVVLGGTKISVIFHVLPM